MQVTQKMTLAEMHVKCLLILMDLLGPDIFAEVTNERTSFAVRASRLIISLKFSSPLITVIELS